MILLRLLLILAALIVVLSGGMYLFTRDPKYLGFAWQVVRFLGYMLMAFALLYLLERVGLASWVALL